VLKTRIMPTLLYKDVGLVRSVEFDSWRRIGSAMQAVKVYNMRQVDELVLLDIAATRDNREPDYDMVDELADECFMPLAVGGGITDVEHVRKLLRVGADKVIVNSAAAENPKLVADIARRFGSQCVVASIDARARPNGAYEVLTHAGTRPTGKDPVRLAEQYVAQGVGEILLTSIDRDGTMKGYDVELVRRVSAAVSVPVIVSGGAGSYDDFAAGLEAGASAVAASSMFHFTQQTPLEAKRFLREKGFNVRA
jgi:cyclase